MSVVDVNLRQVPLPERVYLVCDDKAYSCLPLNVFQGLCYLAYLVPLIREVQHGELGALYAPTHIRNRRELSRFEKVVGIMISSYGIYVTQREINVLSRVLESHLNVSSKAMLTEHKGG